MNEITRFLHKKHFSGQGHRNGSDAKEPDNLENCASVDLEELFQFSAARQRALEKNAKLDYVEPFKNFMPNMVFINHVDSFNGKVIADYLSDQSIAVEKVEESVKDDEEEIRGETESLVYEEEESPKVQESSYEKLYIVGTVDFMKNRDYIKPESVKEILDEENKEEFLAKILTCGIIIYDISNALNCHPFQINEAAWVLQNLVAQLETLQRYAPKFFKKYKDRRIFVLISTMMTWAKTKPIDPEDLTLPLTERDYRKRRPHPNYKVHQEFEKKVVEMGKKFPDNLKTIVIGSGVTYGYEEDVLHFLFKMAWLNAPELPLFKPGNNKIPLIHIDTLANIIHLILTDFPENIKYIIAVEQSPTKLKTIVKLISKKLGSGQVKKIDKEEALTYPDIKQRNYDMLTANINVIPGYILSLNLTPTAEMTFRENIDRIIAEFRGSRNLTPIKILIHGPPASGKSLLSKQLADHYKIHHLHAKWVIEEGIKDIKKYVASKGKRQRRSIDGRDDILDDDDEDSLEDEDEDDDKSENLETMTHFLQEIEESMASNEKKRLDENLLIRLFKKRMLSNACQNQGYVIDGYPKTIEDAKILFEPDQDEEFDGEENDTDDVTRLYNKKIMPSYVVSLDASDEFLIQRVVEMPQSIVQNSHYEEEEMCRRLFEFRELNTEDNTVLIYFDEMEVPLRIYNIENTNDDFTLKRTLQSIIRLLGEPKNYETSDQTNEFFEEKARLNEKYMNAIKQKSRDMIDQRREKMENWMFLKNQEKEMEERALALLAMPLRHYLMKYIFPTVTRGLVEIARVRPPDPVDYLAEFLFKENPEGKMFQPDYDNVEDELKQAMEDYNMSLDNQNEESKIPKQYSMDDSALLDAISNVSLVKEKCSQLSKCSQKSVASDKSKQSQPRLSETRSVSLKEKESSTGSCKCIQPGMQKSSSGSTSSSSTPAQRQTSCTCQPYFTSDSSKSSRSSSQKSEDSCTGQTSNVCKCLPP